MSLAASLSAPVPVPVPDSYAMTTAERAQFDAQGYLLVKGVLHDNHLRQIQNEFDQVWKLEQPKVCQHQLLRYPAFLDLIEHPPILDRHRSIFGSQVQLLQYDLLRQGPASTVAERMWHRDLTFPGDRCLSINTILYLDDMTEEVGPTRVVPGSHRGEALPPLGQRHQPLPNEIVISAEAGDAAFINSAIWHSGGRNRGPGLRRGIYLYYGWWWLKRFENELALPWQAYAGASEQRLRLLGAKMPDPGFHMYDPDRLHDAF